MNSNVNILLTFMVFTILLKISESLPFPPEGYAFKKVQWGVNQERIQLVPRENDENEEYSELDIPESSCTCGHCGECQRKTVLDILQYLKIIGASQDLSVPPSQDLNVPPSFYDRYGQGQPNFQQYFNLHKNIIPPYTSGYYDAVQDPYPPLKNYFQYF